MSAEDVDGLGLGLLDDGLGVGLLDDGVGVALADDGVLVGLADVGLADDTLGVGLAGVEAAALGLVVLAEVAVSWAAQGLAAAGAALAVPVSNAAARLAGTMINPEITLNAWAVARRLLMDPPSAPWSSSSRVAFAAMMSLSTWETFPTTPIRHLAGLPKDWLGLKAHKTVGDDRLQGRRGNGRRVDSAG